MALELDYLPCITRFIPDTVLWIEWEKRICSMAMANPNHLRILQATSEHKVVPLSHRRYSAFAEENI